jgi:FkbM family methyltransferase
MNAAAQPIPPSPLEMARRLLEARPGALAGTALDVGAHHGEFSRALLASGLFSQVVAFEANPANAGQLAGFTPQAGRLTVVPCAVGSVAGHAQFHHDDDSATGSLLAYGDAYVNRGAVRSFSVPVTRLDDYVAAAAPASAVTLLKIDTQGHDLEVLRGAQALLARDRPLVIAEVIYLPLYAGQASPEEIAAFMGAAGYELYTLFNIHASLEGRLAFADALYAPREWPVPHSQRFVQLDNHGSYLAQIGILDQVCRERLDVIHVLDAEVKRLASRAKD